MPTTSNFGWTTPADTDLVKDGAAAIRTLGNGIDASFIDLKGGTTNQVLAKNSDTDLDFKWVADATGIPATIFDAKGDLIAASAADTAARLAVGTNGQVLTADSTTSTGLKWASLAADLTISQIASGSLPAASSLSLTGLSTYDTIIVRINGVTIATNNASVLVTINNNTGNNYELVGGYNQTTFSTYFGSTGTDKLYAGFGAASQLRTNADNFRFYVFTNCKAAGFTNAVIQEGYVSSGGDTPNSNSIGLYKVAEAVSSIQFKTSTGDNYTAGSYVIWGG